jgi:hypothetical protein
VFLYISEINPDLSTKKRACCGNIEAVQHPVGAGFAGYQPLDETCKKL